MRYLIAIVTALLLTSCSHVQRGGDLARTRDSVYKVQVSLKLDLQPLREWQDKRDAERKKREDERKKKEEGGEETPPSRWWPKFWSHPVAFLDEIPISLNRAQQTTDLQVLRTTADTAELAWSGTGWVAAKAAGRSYVMTAGHVCESRESYAVEVFDVDWEAGTFTTTTIDLPIIEKKHLMLSRDGVESANGVVVKDDDLDEKFNGNDLCILGVAGDLGPIIEMADHDPRYGDICSVVGAPTGLWGGGIAVASEAIYSGRGAVFGTDPDGLAFNGLLAPGNSGSAVVCEGEAVGTISLGSTRFRSLTHAVPYERMRKFMDLALHQKK